MSEGPLENQPRVEPTGVPAWERFAAIQAAAEIALGSIVHGFHIPFGGHMLSVNQGLILTFALRAQRLGGETRRVRAVSTVSRIALIAALLKSLSPLGKRLMPMVAITMQGFLYSVGIMVIGLNAVGVAVGMALLAVWGFIQPLLTTYLVFGQPWIAAVLKLWNEVAASLGVPYAWGWTFVGAVVGLKVVLAMLIGTWAWRAGARWEAQYLERIQRWAERAGPRPIPASADESRRSRVLASFGDLISPWFLGSAVLSIAFMRLSREADTATVIFYGLRVVALGWLAFFLARSIPRKWTERWLRRLTPRA